MQMNNRIKVIPQAKLILLSFMLKYLNKFDDKNREKKGRKFFFLSDEKKLPQNNGDDLEQHHSYLC